MNEKVEGVKTMDKEDEYKEENYCIKLRWKQVEQRGWNERSKQIKGRLITRGRGELKERREINELWRKSNKKEDDEIEEEMNKGMKYAKKEDEEIKWINQERRNDNKRTKGRKRKKKLNK